MASSPNSNDGDGTAFLVRVGLHGQVGRFQAIEEGRLRRQDRVVCRTLRGLEVGHVLQPTQFSVDNANSFDGRILRRMRAEDELLWGHLQQLAEQTHQACREWFAQSPSDSVLLDVEPLLDGRTLYFHFLSEVSDDVQHHLDRLVQTYEEQVRNSQFARLLEHGCGPGCGTSKAKNACVGCAVCKVASACKESTQATKS